MTIRLPRRSCNLRTGGTSALVLLLFAAMSTATTYRATTPAELIERTADIASGDTLLVSPGNYDMSTWNISGKSGASGDPIVIAAEGAVAIRGTSGCCNLVQMTNVHHLIFRGFEITMRDNFDGIDGINIQGVYSSHIALENLYIHGMTNCGIGMWPDSAAHITLQNSEIAHNTGSGLYWGYPGRNIIHDVLIANNYIHHCPEDSLQDTHYGIQWKGWCYRATIRDNVLHDVGGVTRCGIVVYYGKTPLSGDVPSDVNVVQGNVLWNCRNEGITAMSDARIENNIVFSAGVGINLQRYSDESFVGQNAVQNLVVRNNTVYRCRSTCISVAGLFAGDATCVFAGNVAYQTTTSGTAVSGSVSGSVTVLGNVRYGTCSLTGASAGSGLSDFLHVTAIGLVPDLNFYPSTGSALVSTLSAQYASTDFNGTQRPQGSAADAGAYEQSGVQNPGWIIKGDFKDSTGTAVVSPRLHPVYAPGAGGGRSSTAIRLLRAHGVLAPVVVAPGTYRSVLTNGRTQ